jgi:hypothetical protein
MFLNRTCPFTGTLNTMEIPISSKEFQLGTALWEAGVNIQDAFPTLNADEREFIKTGILPATWDAMFVECDCCGEDDNA